MLWVVRMQRYYGHFEDGLEEISFFALGTLSLTNVYKSIKIFLLYSVRMCERIIL